MTDAGPMIAGTPVVPSLRPASPTPAVVVAPAGLQIATAPADTLLLIAIWGDVETVGTRLAEALGALPAVGRAAVAGARRTLWWEPRTWLVCAPADDRDVTAERLAERVGGDGAVTDVSGGWRRIRVQGPRWRELMMLGAVFDAESASFEPGCVAGTIIHHLPVRLDVVAHDIVDAYTPPSYADELLHHWTAARRRFDASG